MQCSTSMVGVFEAAGMLARGSSALALVGGVESMSRVQIGLGCAGSARRAISGNASAFCANCGQAAEFAHSDAFPGLRRYRRR